MRTVALCQQKGGVGKTTTSYHLASAGRRLGLRVLVVDLDPQANLTFALLPDHDPEAVSVADALSEHVGDVQLRDVLEEGLWGSHVLPAAPSLATVENELVIAKIGRERRFATQLAELGEDYDLALIDCPPSLGLLAISALVAADVALPVVQPSQFALNGLSQLLGTIEEVRALTPVRMPGVVVNGIETAGGRVLVDQRAALEQLHEADVPILAQIPKSVAISGAQARSAALHQTPGGYPLAELYLAILRDSALTEEVA